MSDKQTEALKLADQLEDDLHADDGTTLGLYSQGIADNAAAELRRLYKSNQQLVKALQPFVLANSSNEHINLMVRTDDITKARAAIREALMSVPNGAEQPKQSPKFDPNEFFAREEAAQARVREFMRNH